MQQGITLGAMKISAWEFLTIVTVIPTVCYLVTAALTSVLAHHKVCHSQCQD